MAVQKFAVQVPQATLDDLHRRLESVRWPDEMPGARWDFGTDLGYLKSFVAYWRRSYDWRRQEAARECNHGNTTGFALVWGVMIANGTWTWNPSMPTRYCGSRLSAQAIATSRESIAWSGNPRCQSDQLRYASPATRASWP